jgi:GMP synthase (glutamine-hydrolysing)
MRVVAVHQEPGSSLDSFEAPVRARGHELTAWHAWSEPAPHDLLDAGAVIVLGGMANPDQTGELPWLAHERDLLAELVAAGTPVLGLCLGAQLLASALGAAVRRLPRAEIGWYEITVAPAAADDPLLAALPGRFRAFEWHDYVFEVPEGGTLLAGSQTAPHQAVRLAPNAWALQFHLEVGAGTIARWTAEGAHELREKRVDRARLEADTATEATAYVEHATAVAGRFLALAEARAAAPRARALS